MKVRLITILTVLLVSSAGAVPTLPGAAAMQSSIAPVYLALPQAVRDGADEDTVFYNYGFENGWNGWTTRDVTASGDKWHITESHAFSGRSWWAGDEDAEGYEDHWLQYLETPAIDLRGRQNLSLKFMAYWSCENPTLSPPADSGETAGYDGWDGCNVWISVNNGETWQVIEPVSPAYTDTSLFSFGFEWGMGTGIPGWTESSGNAEWPAGQWVEATFNLSAYNDVQQAKIRWAFASDPAWHTGEDPDNDGQAWGFLVDSMYVRAGNEVVWSNNGEQQGEMAIASGAGSGNFWEITDDDAHDGEFSARCPIESKLTNSLNSPPIEVQPGWNTYFDFWVRCDMTMPDANEDGYLDDYWEIQYSTDNRNWNRMLYDWSRDDTTWTDDFHFFSADSFFMNQTNIDKPAWMRRLNLSPFAGETVYLRWLVHTDTVVTEGQGSGFYFDDFRISGNLRQQDDVGIEWIDANYPNTMGLTTVCSIGLRNYGINDQGQVVKWAKLDENPRFPVQQWDGIPSDSLKIYNFNFTSARLQYADSVTITAYSVLNVDTNRVNDTGHVATVVYPAGIWKLGYDSRKYDTPYNFTVDNGPAVRYTPAADGIAGSYDIKALRVLWNNAQDANVTTHMSIFRDNRGNFGARLYEADVTVRPEDCLPAVHVIDLSGVQALQRLSGDFWVYFNIERQDNWPQIMGRAEQQGRGHYFVSNGQARDTVDIEYQMHAILMTAGNSPTNALIAGRATVNFDTVASGEAKTRRVALYNGGVNEVTVSEANTENGAFQVVGFTPTTLRIGDMMTVYVTYTANDGNPIGSRLVFRTSDPTPPVVGLVANGGVVSVGDESTSPYTFNLGIAYPNPFNATTVIPYSVGVDGLVKVAVYDLSGRLVTELVNGEIKAGNHSIKFHADELAAGSYMLRMEAGSFKSVQKLVLVK